MNTELENLQSTIKRKYSFKYKPEFTESFKTEIEEGQIIPLIIEVLEKLDWPIVFRDKKSVEAKRKGDWNKLTEKITVTKKASGRIEVHSKSLESNFIDFGNNSKRTGLFIAVFQKLSSEYQKSGKLKELETEFNIKDNWEDYEIPSELPKPKEYRKPNLALTIIGGIIISVFFGILFAVLTFKFTYFIFIYEVALGIGIGYFFGQILKKTNYTEFRQLQFIIGMMVLVMFITSQFIRYQLAIAEHNIFGFNFFEYIKMLFKQGFKIDNFNTGWIGLTIIWAIQIVLPYFIAIAKVAGITANYIIKKIPEKVLEYAIYLLDTGKSESEVRAELSQKGWTKKSDQDNVFQAIIEISGFQEINRE